MSYNWTNCLVSIGAQLQPLVTMFLCAEYFWTELPHLFKKYNTSSVSNLLGGVFDNANMKTVINGSDYSIAVQEYFQKGFKAGTTQVTRIFAKLSTAGADSDFYQASNIYELTRLWFRCLSKKHTPAKNE